MESADELGKKSIELTTPAQFRNTGFFLIISLLAFSSSHQTPFLKKADATVIVCNTKCPYAQGRQALHTYVCMYSILITLTGCMVLGAMV